MVRESQMISVFIVVMVMISGEENNNIEQYLTTSPRNKEHKMGKWDFIVIYVMM